MSQYVHPEDDGDDQYPELGDTKESFRYCMVNARFVPSNVYHFEYADQNPGQDK
jgi:hypothetical protein